MPLRKDGDYLSAWRTTDTFRWPHGKVVQLVTQPQLRDRLWWPGAF